MRMRRIALRAGHAYVRQRFGRHRERPPMKLFHCRHCRERFITAASGRARRCPRCRRRLSPVWMPDPPRAAPGSYAEGRDTYASLDDFLAADQRRLASRETDFGLHWRGDDGNTTYRAAWIEATGELYVVQSGSPLDGGGHVEVLAVTGRAVIEAALGGHSGHASVAWMRRRVASLPQLSASLRGIGAVALGATVLALGGPGPDRQADHRAALSPPPAGQRNDA
jgi:hypothetical protein